MQWTLDGCTAQQHESRQSKNQDRQETCATWRVSVFIGGIFLGNQWITCVLENHAIVNDNKTKTGHGDHAISGYVPRTPAVHRPLNIHMGLFLEHYTPCADTRLFACTQAVVVCETLPSHKTCGFFHSPRPLRHSIQAEPTACFGNKMT